MHLRYGMIADSVSEGMNKKKVVVGIFDILWAASFPAAHPQMALFLRIEGAGSEIGDHTLRVELVDADYRPIAPPFEAPMKMAKVTRPVPEAPLSAEVVMNFQGLPLPREGDYEFTVQVDGRHLGVVPLYVRRSAGA